MPEKIRRHFLKAKEAVGLLGGMLKKVRVDLEQAFEGKASVEVIEAEFAEVFLVDGKPVLAKVGEILFPTLVFSEFLVSAPKVVVDMGAVPHVCNGANVMAPGIVRFEGEFGKGEFVLVVDEKHGKSLAVGEALLDFEDAGRVKQGVVVETVHHVGDKVWNFIKKHDTLFR